MVMIAGTSESYKNAVKVATRPAMKAAVLGRARTIPPFALLWVLPV